AHFCSNTVSAGANMKSRGARGVALSECLERRLVLNGAFAHVSSRGTLIVTGDDNANTISVALQDANTIAVTKDASVLTFDSSTVKRIYIDGAGGTDFIANAVKLRATTLGGAGDDTIHGGKAADSILGGDGNDAIKGGAGNDTIDGERGNDIMVGGGGTDAVSFHSS